MLDEAEDMDAPPDVGLLATALAAGGVCSAVEALALDFGEALRMNARLSYRYAQERKALDHDAP